jgi:hypothetical protein
MDSSTASTASLSRLISALCLARFAEVFRRDRSRLAWCMFSATRATKRHGTRDLRRSPGACIFVCKSGKEKFSSLGYEVSREARKARNASCTPFMRSMDRSVPSAFWQPEKAAELTYGRQNPRCHHLCLSASSCAARASAAAATSSGSNASAAGAPSPPPPTGPIVLLRNAAQLVFAAGRILLRHKPGPGCSAVGSMSSLAHARFG